MCIFLVLENALGYALGRSIGGDRRSLFLSKVARQGSSHSAERGGVWTLFAGTGTLCFTV